MARGRKEARVCRCCFIGRRPAPLRASPRKLSSRSKASGKARWKRNGLRLRLQLHVSHDSEDQLVAALDSLDQGVSGLPPSTCYSRKPLFTLKFPRWPGAFEGTLGSRQNKLSGNWSQTGAEAKLEFVRSDQPLNCGVHRLQRNHILSRGRDFVLQCDSRSFAGRTLTLSNRRWALSRSTADCGFGAARP